jgi:hypothetical protein
VSTDFSSLSRTTTTSTMIKLITGEKSFTYSYLFSPLLHETVDISMDTICQPTIHPITFISSSLQSSPSSSVPTWRSTDGNDPPLPTMTLPPPQSPTESTAAASHSSNNQPLNGELNHPTPTQLHPPPLPLLPMLSSIGLFNCFY